ncbi:MAG: glycosyltransferase [Candidatus Hodarchaeota archaeon]
MVKLLIIFTFNISLNNVEKSGYLARAINYYKKLTNQDIELTLLTYGNYNDLKYSKLLSNVKILPCLKYIYSKNSKLKFIKSLLIPFKLKSLFKDIDIITTTQIRGSWVGIIAKILYNKKIILRGGYEWYRNVRQRFYFMDKKNYLNFLYNLIKIYTIEFIAYKLADAIILTNESDIDFIIKAFKLKGKRKKIQYIPNFIDVNQFKPNNLKKKVNHILFIGRLSPEKNLFNLLNAIKNLRFISLDIIGSGPDENKLKIKAKELGININFLGMIPNDQLPKIINQYSIFVLPSFYEGNPKVLLEAMSCGLACIGTNVRGINNIIKHEKNGYLCETNSTSISNAISKVYNNRELREKIGKAARSYIVNNCSLNSIIDKEYSLYKSILKKF